MAIIRPIARARYAPTARFRRLSRTDRRHAPSIPLVTLLSELAQRGPLHYPRSHTSLDRKRHTSRTATTAPPVKAPDDTREPRVPRIKRAALPNSRLHRRPRQLIASVRRASGASSAQTTIHAILCVSNRVCWAATDEYMKADKTATSDCVRRL